MKYIKKYESIDKSSLHFLLCNFLEKIKIGDFSVNRNYYQRGEKHGVAIAFMCKYKSSKTTTHPVFVIRLLPVNEKQLRDSDVKTKMKVFIDCCYDAYVEDTQFLSSLKDFIVDTFKKYSYFNKKQICYNVAVSFRYDFFIHVSDVEKIMNELNNDFEMYVDSKKYNL